MRCNLFCLFLLMFLAMPVHAQEPDSSDEKAAPAEDEATAEASDPNGDGIESPRSMSGMSILGNEEAPKALVIIPWKSSELGDDISLSDTLEERAQPVDREVFTRELNFYRIRSGE